MRFLYTLLFYCSLPLLILRLFWKSRHHASLRKRWSERLGYVPAILSQQGTLWIHAVSLGETITAVPLIKELLLRYPEHHIVITTTTFTGSLEVERQLGDQVHHFYLPYDLPSAIIRFSQAIRAKLLIILETEIWPNLLYHLQKQCIPVILANARLSEQSFKKYQWIKKFLKPILASFSFIIAQSVADQERFFQLGVSRGKLRVSGNLKFDLQIPEELKQDAKNLRQYFKTRPIFIAGSTHEGEEKIVLNAWKKLRENYPDLLLIVVPRHPERFDKIAQLCQQYSNAVIRKSQFHHWVQSIDRHCDILVGDTIGELRLLYAACDIAFVGGSLVPIGGHNLIEPAVFKKAIISGPHLHHFSNVAQWLREGQALCEVKGEDDLIAAVNHYFSDPQSRRAMGLCAYEVSQAHQGALKKHLQWIDNVMINSSFCEIGYNYQKYVK